MLDCKVQYSVAMDTPKILSFRAEPPTILLAEFEGRVGMRNERLDLR